MTKPEVTIPAGMIDWTDEREILRAEIERLRAARTEQNDEYLSLQQENERLRAELAATREVIEAARHVAAIGGTPMRALSELRAALTRLDAATALDRPKAN